ncbi:conserved hypothetical protein [Psychromonas ingrahamii 37]|uniref:RanBP2-type domain-containing protein n=2 Tax=Psychromonas ingrahamii TaxID=357794 RepID=A1SW40_PSYIN|nr:conserved hypothetical protein [Psychromonas ingrahamii 37]
MATIKYSIMKMVYTNESHFLANNVKNLIEAQEINTFLKNEFAQGAMGEISPLDSWPEVWVYNNSDFDRALEIATSSQSSSEKNDWICKNCSEKNDPSFEICWNCQRENAQ